TDKARVRGAATATYRRQLRELPTQPRRARLRTAHERATGARAGRARAGEGDAHLRPWLQAPSGATAQQRRTPAPPGPQPAPVAAWRAGPVLRRRDRHGGRPDPQGAELRA